MINIFLDLDNTLISAEAFDEMEPKDVDRIVEKMTKFDYSLMDDIYIICARPHLQEFLDYLFKNFNVSIWTAASKDYAAFIIDKFILTKDNRKLDLVLFDKHCNTSSKRYNYQKKLQMIWKLFPEYSAENTYIIDDLPEVCEAQPPNCLTIAPFEFMSKNSEKDNALVAMKQKLITLLKQTYK